MIVGTLSPRLLSLSGGCVAGGRQPEPHNPSNGRRVFHLHPKPRLLNPSVGILQRPSKRTPNVLHFNHLRSMPINSSNAPRSGNSAATVPTNRSLPTPNLTEPHAIKINVVALGKASSSQPVHDRPCLNGELLPNPPPKSQIQGCKRPPSDQGPSSR